MKVVLTGEAELALQQRLAAIVSSALASGQEKHDLDLRKNSLEETEQLLGEQSLFGAQKIWIVQGWQSLRSPKQADALLTLFSEHTDDVVLIIPDKITPAKKKKLSAPWKIENFSLPANVFTFLESIGVQPLPKLWPLYLQALDASGEWGVHALAARQTWMILQYQAGEESVRANPWIAKKLSAQAKAHSTKTWLQFASDLFDIEFGIKSGKNKLPWREQFDVTLAKLYAHRVEGKS